MKLASYGSPGSERAALVLGDDLVDLANAAEYIGAAPLPTDMLGILSSINWRERIARLDRDGDQLPRIPLSTQRLGGPVPIPGKLILAAANTHSHVAEAHAATHGKPSLLPALIGKASSSVCGPRDAIVKPAMTDQLDYEVELGLVIGTRARNVRESQALDFVAGFMVSNDVSARDLQVATHETNRFYAMHYIGKSCDTFCPCGPSLVTADEVGDVESLRMRTYVNGELRQDALISDLVFSPAELVSFASSVMTLLPGDVIICGSPAGVGALMDPPSYLDPGDVVTCEIEGLGSLVNAVVEDYSDVDEDRLAEIRALRGQAGLARR